VHNEASGIAILCALLFLEEAGVPLPVAPGEAVLIGAGLLVASGSAPIWLVVPLAYVAVIGGVLTGYGWAHRIGPKRVHALAVRLHAAAPYDRAAARLQGAAPLQIAASRLLPGLRVYTSLVAGAVDVNMGRFMAGVLPASALWVVAFIGLGFSWVRQWSGSWAASKPMDCGRRWLRLWSSSGWWLRAACRPCEFVAARIDLVAITAVAGALVLLTGLALGDSSDLPFAAVIFALLGILYLVAARQTVGSTLGEALLDVRYHPPRRSPLLRVR
jgi:membrane-associated protein